MRGFLSLQSILPALPASKLRPGYPNASPADILEAAWLRIAPKVWAESEQDQPVDRAGSGAIVTGDDWFDDMERQLWAGELDLGNRETQN